MKILAIILFSYLTLSIIGFIVLIFRKELTPPENQRPIYYFPIMIGTLISLFYIFFQGFKQFLVIIPHSWGSYNEDGEWGSYRDTAAVMFTLATIYYFFYLMAEVARKEKVIQRLTKNRKQDKE